MFFTVSGRYRLIELERDILPGHVVGELGLFAPDTTRTGTLECVEDGELWKINYAQVKQLYYENPEFGFYFVQLITRRLFENIERLENELAHIRRLAAPLSPPEKQHPEQSDVWRGARSSTRQMTWRLRAGGGAVHNVKRRMAMNVTRALAGQANLSPLRLSSSLKPR